MKAVILAVICVAGASWGWTTFADAPPETPVSPGSEVSPSPSPSLSSSPSVSASGDDLQAELLAMAPAVPPYSMADPIPIAWENSNHPERKLWSEYAFSVIHQYFDELDQAEDTSRFCKKYKTLNQDEKIAVWAQIFAGISYWETGWDPANRTVEGPGLDEITHEKPISEGLLQLSYSDMNNYTDLDSGDPYCPFDWSKDQVLPATDLHRTILNPYINLYCGIRIMADSIVTNVKKGKKRVVYNEYWSTLGSGFYIHNRAGNIRRTVETLPFCGGHPLETPQDLLLKMINKIQKTIKRAHEKNE
jgi:hypothetical protein